jgi:hypothetical protein
MSNRHQTATSDLGTIAWTEHTGGALTRREQRALARPLARGHRDIVLGHLALAVRRHRGRHVHLDPATLVAPDSTAAREAAVAAADLLSPAVLQLSHRAYAWGAALAALDELDFDRELLYVASMFHDTGLPSGIPDVDFTVRSAGLLRLFADRHGMSPAQQEVMTNAIALHHTPGVTTQAGPEAYLLSAGAGVDVFGLRAGDLPDAVRREVVQQHPRLGFKQEFTRLWRAEAQQVPRGRAAYLRRYAVTDVTIRLAPFRG